MAYKEREKYLAYQREYNQREERKKKRNEYNRRHREQNKERYNLKAKERKRRIKQQVMEAYGGRCVCCGEGCLEFLTIHHINEDGAVHRKMINNSGGHSFYYWLRSQGFPLGFEVLCFNCNCAKAYFGGCPHELADTV